MTTAKVGDRVTVAFATVLAVTDYEGRDFLTGRKSVFYQTTIKDNDGQVFKFSGPNSDLKKGDCVTVKVTIKKFDNQRKYIKLNRVRIVERHSSMWKGLNYA